MFLAQKIQQINVTSILYTAVLVTVNGQSVGQWLHERRQAGDMAVRVPLNNVSSEDDGMMGSLKTLIHLMLQTNAEHRPNMETVWRMLAVAFGGSIMMLFVQLKVSMYVSLSVCLSSMMW